MGLQPHVLVTLFHVFRYCHITHCYNAVCYSAPVGERSIAISLSVCVSVHLPVSMYVCLSVSISLEPLDWTSRYFVCRSAGLGSVLRGGVAICYVLPVLWMRSRLATVGQVGQTTTTSSVATPAQSLDVYEWLVLHASHIWTLVIANWNQSLLI